MQHASEIAGISGNAQRERETERERERERDRDRETQRERERERESQIHTHTQMHGVRHGQKFGRANTEYIVYNNYNSL